MAARRITAARWAPRDAQRGPRLGARTQSPRAGTRLESVAVAEWTTVDDLVARRRPSTSREEVATSTGRTVLGRRVLSPTVTAASQRIVGQVIQQNALRGLSEDPRCAPGLCGH
jgi:hypothetical protein